MFAQDLGQAPHGICHLLLFRRQVFLFFAFRLRPRHAGHAAAALSALELKVLQHVGDVGQQLPRLFGRAGIGQVLQGVQHVLEILPAKTLTTAHGHAILICVRHLTAIGDGLCHLCGEVFIGCVAESFHAAADFFLGGAIPQGLLQRPASRFQPAQRIGSAAIFRLQRQRPEQRVNRPGFFL